MLRRQTAASRLSEARSQGPLSSNLPGGALEVCHAEVGGWRDSQNARVCEREGYVGGCSCVVSASWWNSRIRVLDSAALGGWNANVPHCSLLALAAVPAHFALPPHRPVQHRRGGGGEKVGYGDEIAYLLTTTFLVTDWFDSGYVNAHTFIVRDRCISVASVCVSCLREGVWVSVWMYTLSSVWMSHCYSLRTPSFTEITQYMKLETSRRNSFSNFAPCCNSLQFFIH